MPYTCDVETQRIYRKRYRDKNKEKIAKIASPAQKKARVELKKLGICYRCFKNKTSDGRSYCEICLAKANIATAKYRANKRKLK